MRRTAVFKLGTLAALFILAVMLIACESSDPTAVQGSQIILTAQPNPVDLSRTPLGESLITARILTGNGTPQKDTIVFFSTNNGTVTPVEDTTDDEGRAFTTFSSNVTTTATVTAQSGSASASQQIQVLRVLAVIHSLTSSDPVVEIACTDTVPLTGRVLGALSAPVTSVPVTFGFRNASPSSLTGFTTPITVITDSNGNYSTNWTMDAGECQSQCVNNLSCSIDVFATAAGLESNVVPVTENL